MLRDLSGLGDSQARSIVSAWYGWQLEDVIGTITELQHVSETDRSLEFDALFRAAASFPHPQIRLESVRSLSNGGSIKTAHSLIAVIERDEVPEIRAAAAEALFAFSVLSQARNLSKITLDRIKSALRSAVHFDETIVRGKALKALAALRDEDAPDLIDETFDEAIGDSALMSDVLAAMGETCARSWLPTIEDAFYSDDAQVRIAAVIAFGKIANDNDVDCLAEPFDDHILEVQVATIKALEQIGTARAREMLALAASSIDSEVQQLAQLALETLKAEDDLMYAVSPTMVERGLFGHSPSARSTSRELSRYDAPTKEGWANVTSEGQELDIADIPEDIGEDYEDYLESEEFFRESNTN